MQDSLRGRSKYIWLSILPNSLSRYFLYSTTLPMLNCKQHGNLHRFLEEFPDACKPARPSARTQPIHPTALGQRPRSKVSDSSIERERRPDSLLLNVRTYLLSLVEELPYVEVIDWLMNHDFLIIDHTRPPQGVVDKIIVSSIQHG